MPPAMGGVLSPCKGWGYDSSELPPRAPPARVQRFTQSSTHSRGTTMSLSSADIRSTVSSTS